MDRRTPIGPSPRGYNSLYDISDRINDDSKSKRRRTTHETWVRAGTSERSSLRNEDAPDSKPIIDRLELTRDKICQLYVVLYSMEGEFIAQDSLDQFLQPDVRFPSLSVFNWPSIEQWILQETTSHNFTHQGEIYIGPGLLNDLGKTKMTRIITAGDLRTQFTKYLQRGAVETDIDGYAHIPFYIAAVKENTPVPEAIANQSIAAVEENTSHENMDINTPVPTADMELSTPSRAPRITNIQSRNRSGPDQNSMYEDAESQLVDLTHDDDIDFKPVTTGGDHADEANLDVQPMSDAKNELSNDVQQQPTAFDSSTSHDSNSIIDVDAESSDDGSHHQQILPTKQPELLDMDNNSEPDDGTTEDDIDEVERIANQCSGYSIIDEDWLRICRLFQCPPDVKAHQPPGFKLQLAGYQMCGVWWMLTQWHRSKTPGGILGDEMGLGKTIQVLSVFAIFAAIKSRWLEVKKSHANPESDVATRHLPPGIRQNSEDKCPTQDLMPFGIQCPCLISSDSYQIAKDLRAFPTLCLVPPSALQTWEKEYHKLLDQENAFVRSLHFTIFHTEYEGNKLYLTNDKIKDSAGCYIAGRDIKLRSEPDLANWCIVASNHGAKSLRVRYQEKFSRLPRTVITYDRLVLTFVFFDEAHNFWGASKYTTIPYTTVSDLQQGSGNLMKLFCITGSFRNDGPKNLHNFIGFLAQVRTSQGRDALIADLTQKAIVQLEADWKYLVEHANDTNPKERTIQMVEAKKATFVQQTTALYRNLLLARNAKDKFRGDRLKTKDVAKNDITINCDMLDGPARNAFGDLTNLFSSSIKQALDSLVAEWKEGGEKGEQPEIDKAVQDIFGRDIRAKSNLNKAWNILDRCNSFPQLALLVQQERLLHSQLASEHIQNMASVTATIAVESNMRGKVKRLEKEFEKTYFWEHRAALIKESPKYAALKTIVDEMVSYRKEKATGLDPPESSIEPDDYNIRHMIILVQNPVSVFITFMLLSMDFHDIHIVPLMAITPLKAKTASPNYGREEIMTKLSSRCGPKSRNQIIITTYAVGGESLNMQRANYCVLMEPALTNSATEQGLGRVYRIGQGLQVEIRRLVDKYNLLEAVRLKRRENQEALLKLQEPNFSVSG